MDNNPHITINALKWLYYGMNIGRAHVYATPASKEYREYWVLGGAFEQSPSYTQRLKLLDGYIVVKRVGADAGEDN